jgi:resuscitation-promoting factor RpfA
LQSVKVWPVPLSCTTGAQPDDELLDDEDEDEELDEEELLDDEDDELELDEADELAAAVLEDVLLDEDTVLPPAPPPTPDEDAELLELPPPGPEDEDAWPAPPPLEELDDDAAPPPAPPPEAEEAELEVLGREKIILVSARAKSGSEIAHPVTPTSPTHANPTIALITMTPPSEAKYPPPRP